MLHVAALHHFALYGCMAVSCLLMTLLLPATRLISLSGHTHHQAVPAVQPCLLHTHPKKRWYHTSCQALLHGVTLHLQATVHAH